MSREADTKESQPITSKRDLLPIFEKGARPRSQFALGLEMEILGVRPSSGEAIPYEGDNGIEKVLKALSRSGKWKPVMNGDFLIALQKGSTAITLEPGGQLELSSSAQKELQDLQTEVEQFSADLKEASRDKDIRWIHLGIQPVTPLLKMPWVPKLRYGVMRRYYEKRPGLALEMMARTASLQANLDYESELDAKNKIRLGSLLAPVVAAMYANSAVEEGHFNGVASRRLFIWKETDPDRSEIPSFFMDGTFSFEKYVDYALGVPMYFVVRNDDYIDAQGIRFQDFLDGKMTGVQPILSDWILHLTTIFTDVRLKDHLEFRTADSQPKEMALALMAFWKGLFEPSILHTALARLSTFTHAEVMEAVTDVGLKGLQAKLGKEPILNVARDLVELSVVGLKNEASFLNPLRDLTEEGVSSAEKIRKNWNGNIQSLLLNAALK